MAGQYLGHGENGKAPYVDRVDPLSSFTRRELPPFASDLGLFARVCGDGSCKKRDEQDANEAEEETHL